MVIKKLMAKTFLIGTVLAAILGAGVLIGCTNDDGSGERPESGAAVTQEISERGSGEHGSAGERSGSEGSESAASSSEEAGGATLAPDETFDTVRSGARLVLNYDAASNAFVGTVENTTNNVLSQVRIEVHLSNGTELGPTTPIDMQPGAVATVTLPSTQEPFTGWIAHAEVGSGGEGSQSGGESGEAAMSSPVIPLEQSWDGVLGGLAISARYDAATQSVQSTVRNTLSQTLCYVQAEPHMKSGTQTVGELGPDKLGDLSPGQEATSSVSVASEPGLAGVSFDGYVVHMEVFDCAGPGPMPHTGGEDGSGEGAGGEGSGGEGSESGASAGEEGSRANLAPDETFDAVRAGARLVLNYDTASNSFIGTVENTTNSVLTRVRIEVHLSNGTELGPTTPMDMAPGAVVTVVLPSTQEPFTGWIAHAEVGGGESGGEHGSGSGGESRGEHGNGSGEHGNGGGGEHGSGGEGSGGS